MPYGMQVPDSGEACCELLHSVYFYLYLLSVAVALVSRKAAKLR